MLEEAVQTFYRRGGEESSLMDGVSKQTVKNKIHRLNFPEDKNIPTEKKKVEYLYIDADEDHVSLQFRKKRGDLVVSEDGRKNNGMITKLVYVYEGVEPVAPKSKRNRLINPYYFSGGDENNEQLWKRVWKYIQTHYEVGSLKKIYLNGDGGITMILDINQGICHLLEIADFYLPGISLILHSLYIFLEIRHETEL